MSAKYRICKKRDYDHQTEMEIELYRVMEKYKIDHDKIVEHLEFTRESTMGNKWYHMATFKANRKVVLHPNNIVGDINEFWGLNKWQYLVIDEYGEEFTVDEFENKIISHNDKFDTNIVPAFAYVDDYGYQWLEYGLSL